MSEDTDYKTDYETFWKDLVETDGQLDKDKLMRELYDYHTLMRNAGEVYCHITGNQISKVNTDPKVVIAVAEDHMAPHPAEPAVDGDPVRHFLKLAKRGRTGGASGGEKRAFRVASLLPKLIDDLPGLDGTALRGITCLMHAADTMFATVMDLLEENGFSVTPEVGGKR